MMPWRMDVESEAADTPPCARTVAAAKREAQCWTNLAGFRNVMTLCRRSQLYTLVLTLDERLAVTRCNIVSTSLRPTAFHTCTR